MPHMKINTDNIYITFNVNYADDYFIIEIS